MNDSKAWVYKLYSCKEWPCDYEEHLTHMCWTKNPAHIVLEFPDEYIRSVIENLDKNNFFKFNRIDFYEVSDVSKIIFLKQNNFAKIQFKEFDVMLADEEVFYELCQYFETDGESDPLCDYLELVESGQTNAFYPSLTYGPAINDYDDAIAFVFENFKKIETI